MKVIKSSVELLDQGPGIEGMFKHIERCGRIAYKSEDRITEDSWKRFVKMIEERGHWAVLEHGTVNMILPPSEEALKERLKELHHPQGKWYEDPNGYLHVTTNYRVIKQLGLEKEMVEFWSEDVMCKFHRQSVRIVCNRSTSHQLVRHRIFVFLQESQRYVNYGKEKYGRELTFILPSWVYRVRDELAGYVDSLTGESREWLKEQDGEELWNSLGCIDRTVAGHDRIWRAIEDEYLWETSTDESVKLRPEEARGLLCNDLKTELVMTGFLSDWYAKPAKGSSEKVGFFYLRTAKDAQTDIRVLSESLKELMNEKYELRPTNLSGVGGN